MTPADELRLGEVRAYLDTLRDRLPMFIVTDHPSDWPDYYVARLHLTLPADVSPPIFVFGSNRAGRHGKGAALAARKHHGAIYGRGEGPQGSSYAIPTKDEQLRSLPLTEINHGVYRFIVYADDHPELTFTVTPIGCGLAGYRPEQIAPMFRVAGPNVTLPPEFREVLERRP